MTRVIWKALAPLAVVLLVAVGCGDDANNSDSQSSATPSPTPLPRPVTATGEFTCIAETAPGECPPGLISGQNTMELNFDLSGGPVAGTAAGQKAESSPDCSWDNRTEVVLSGQYNGLGQTFAGTADLTFIKTLTSGAPEQCNPQSMQPIETSSQTGLAWQALLQVDRRTIKGCLLDAAAACYGEFLLSIPLESLNQLNQRLDAPERSIRSFAD